MGKQEVIKVIEDAIASSKNGTWTLPGVIVAFLVALKYLIEKE